MIRFLNIFIFIVEGISFKTTGNYNTQPKKLRVDAAAGALYAWASCRSDFGIWCPPEYRNDYEATVKGKIIPAFQKEMKSSNKIMSGNNLKFERTPSRPLFDGKLTIKLPKKRNIPWRFNQVGIERRPLYPIGSTRTNSNIHVRQMRLRRSSPIANNGNYDKKQRDVERKASITENFGIFRRKMDISRKNGKLHKLPFKSMLS